LQKHFLALTLSRLDQTDHRKTFAPVGGSLMAKEFKERRLPKS
jgi:hypothetical protein